MNLKRRKMNPVKDDWYKFCTISLEWLNPFMNYERQDWERYVDQLLDRAQSINIDTMAYTVDCGGYALWNSDMVEKDRHLGDVDLFEILDGGTHKRGMKFVASWLGFPRRYPGITYETWRRRDAQGNPVQANPLTLVTVCPNTPFGTFTVREFKEVLTQYCIDGIYLEGIWADQGFCFCPYCKEKFKRMYGYDIPTNPADMEKSVDLRRFRADSVTNFVRRLRNVIDEVSPETVFMVCLYPGDDFVDIGKYADVTTMELPDGLNIDMTQTMSRRFAFATLWNSWHVDSNYMQHCDANFKSTFIQKLSHGATPQVHIQNALEVDQSLAPAMQEMYGVVHKVRPYMKDADRVAYAGLYIPWQKNEVLPTYTHETEEIKPFKGFYKSLTENHVPFKLLPRMDLAEGNLSGLQAIVLPNAVKMSDAEIESVRQFVESGGGLVLTYRTSFADENGNLRGGMALADVAGIKGPFGLLTNPSYADYPQLYEILHQHYYRVTVNHPVAAGLKGKLLAYPGGLVEFELGQDTTEIAGVLDYDYARMHWHHSVLGWYPWERIAPLITINEKNSRVVYIGGELDKAAYTQGDYATFNILANAVKWAGKVPLPIETDAPPTVEIVTYKNLSSNSITVFLRNNNITREYVLPLSDINVRIIEKNIRPTEVFTITGAPVENEVAGDTISIRLPRLNDYEVVVIRG